MRLRQLVATSTNASARNFANGCLGNMDAVLDLRRFMDPAPLLVTKRTPLPRVYRMFNEIGVRHLVVVRVLFARIHSRSCCQRR